MNPTPQNKTLNPSEELQAIHQQREALHKIVKITHAVERLLKGMQAVMLMGKSSASIPQSAIAAYESLGQKTANMSTEELQLRLQNLDKLVLGMLERVLEIAGIDHDLLESYIVDPHEDVKSNESEVGKMINNFRRSAQTSVALRILLSERGVTTPPLNFHVPETVINDQIHALEKRESNCRKQVESNIESIREATSNILLNENASEEFKAIVEKIQNDLNRDLKHIKDGKSLEDMPMMVEVVELKDEFAKEEVVEKEVNEEQPANAPEQVTASRKKRGFFYKLFRWITTPPSVKWEDIE